MIRRFCSWLRTWARDQRGGTMTVFAVSAPTLGLAMAGAVEYSSLSARHSRLQKAVDAAALAATQQLRLSNNTDSVVDSTAKSVVAENAPTPNGSVTTVTSEVLNKRTSVKVTASETVSSPMGKLLSMPTMNISASATGQLSGSAKLCLLTLDPKQKEALNLDVGSLITASGCAIYSNSKDKTGLSADKGAQATAALICSAGGVNQKNATLSPTPTTDCPVIADPLAATPRPTVGSCTATDLKVTTSVTLYPGTYCKGIEVKGSGQLTLMPGVYVLDNGPLIVSGTASLSGQNVGLFFTGDQGGLRFDPDTTISLTAPKAGSMAGLLMFEDRTVNAPVPPPPGPKGKAKDPPYGSGPMRVYQITSNNAPTLLGTIYLPAGRLVIDASRPVADRSAYTVIVSKQLDLNSGPNLYLNSNYGATDIPVPEGVGPKSGNVHLSQ